VCLALYASALSDGLERSTEYVVLGQHDNLCMSWQENDTAIRLDKLISAHKPDRKKGIDNIPELAVKYIGPVGRVILHTHYNS
jgi:hypothetical protein